jgi:uncharacterized membrane protein
MKSETVFLIGSGLVGCLAIIFGDFALQWQPVPEGFPARSILAYASGVALIAASTATLFTRTRVAGATGLCALYGVWVCLHVFRVALHLGDASVWLGFFEILASAAASAMVLIVATDAGSGRRSVQTIFGLCPIMFGATHFIYADFTASMVPAWLPFPLAWAWGTGAAHVLAGLAIVSGVQARLATGLLALMFASFIVLLHVPRMMAEPGSRLEWTMTAIALTLTGAALVMWPRVTEWGGKPVVSAVDAG